MISKKLLSTILKIELEPTMNNIDPIPFGLENNKSVIFFWKKEEILFHRSSSIELSTLVSECKSFIKKNKYRIYLPIPKNEKDISGSLFNGRELKFSCTAESESECVIKLAEYVLENQRHNFFMKLIHFFKK